ncbi:MAG: hypothetical protein U0796_18880 [Gemmatales bacterium]
MRIVIVILGILGALGAGGIGAKWLSDSNTHADTIKQLEEYEKNLKASGNQTASNKLSTQMATLNSIVRSAYFLVAGCVGGLIAITLLFLNKIKPQVAGAVLIASAVIPALFEPKSLIFSFFMIVAGGLCFLRRTSSVSSNPVSA